MKPHSVLSLAVVAVFLGLSTFIHAQETKKAKILHFTRSQSFEHAPAKLLDDGTTVSGQGLKTYFSDKNIEVVETQDGSVFDGDLGQYDAFVFYTSGNLLDEKNSKNDKAKPMSAEGLRKMIAAVQKGKGFVGIHSATDSHSNLKDENGADIYTKFVGARFTSHGPQQVATTTVVEPADFRFLQGGLKKFAVHEEWYGMNQFNKDIHVILILETAGMTSGQRQEYARPPFPISWIRKEGQGRVAYSGFGHGNNYFQDMESVRRIGELIEWSIGRFDADTTPNIEKVTPGAFE